MIGYCVPMNPELASFRFRVSIPASNLTVPYCYGVTGTPTFFYKEGNVALARSLKTGVVYDVVNDHFTGEKAEAYHGMVAAAQAVTCCSEAMAEVVRKATGRDAVVIDDPYENPEQPAAVNGEYVLWFGHGANISTLKPYADTPNLRVMSNVKGAIPWSRVKELSAISQAAVVLLTGKPTASSNRIAKAIRAGRFVVTPGGVPAWEQFRDYCWIGDVNEGVQWALNNREEACHKITKGQSYISETFRPTLITGRWMEVFGSISALETRSSKAGSA